MDDRVHGRDRGAGVGDRGEGRGGVAVDGRGVRVHGGVQHDGAPDYEHLAHRTWQVVPTC